MIYIKITPKQDKFCRNIVSGMSLVDSYADAYDTKASREVMRVEGSKLMSREDIRQHIETLQAPVRKAIIETSLTDYDKLKKLAIERLELAIERNDDAYVIKYMDIINKMIGSYVNINHNINDNKPEAIINLDTAKLKKLLE